MKNYLLLLMISICSASIVYPCTYIQNSFCSSNFTYPEDVLLAGKIIQVDTNGISLEVIEVLRGNEPRDTVRIWDIPDVDCNGTWPMAASTMGNLNDSIIATLPLIDSITNSWDVVGDYRRPINLTLTRELIYSRDSVFGFISGYIYGPWSERSQSMNYRDFKNYLSTSECQSLVSVNEPAEIGNISFSPNPVETFLEIHFEKMNYLESNIEVYTSGGQKIFSTSSYLEKIKIDLSNFPSGLYFVKINHQNTAHKVFKIIKK